MWLFSFRTRILYDAKKWQPVKTGCHLIKTKLQRLLLLEITISLNYTCFALRRKPKKPNNAGANKNAAAGKGTGFI